MIGSVSFSEARKRQPNLVSHDEFECKIPKLVLKKCDHRQIGKVSNIKFKSEPYDEDGCISQRNIRQAEQKTSEIRQCKEEVIAAADDDGNTEEEEENSMMSDYEKKRLQNIKDNAKFFASLEIFKTKEQLSSINGNNRKNSTTPKIVKKDKVVLRAPSLRLRRQGPDGQTLPPKPVVRYIDEITTASNRRNERKPTGPIQMLPTNMTESSKENSSIKVSKMMKYVTNSPNSSAADKLQPDLQALGRSFNKMKITPERVAKVTKERVYSIAIHPSKEKVLVFSGDKGGHLGMWDVGSKNEEKNGILTFEPHASPVNCLHFAPANTSKIYSSSYDGTIRCGDFEKGVFQEVYATTTGRHIYISHFDFLTPDGSTLIAAQNDGDGHVAVIDTRVSSSAENVYRLHDKSIRTVSVHPLKSNYIVTGSKDGTVALWDTRSLKSRGKNKHILRLQHGGGVTAAYFSPLTGKKLLTTAHGDSLRVYTFSENGAVFLRSNIRHNNFVGRWLTSFRAIWHPQREDVFVSGSMERPRRIEVFNDRGDILHRFMDEDSLGTVCSINAFHPTRNILVGGNSSGRLHVFM